MEEEEEEERERIEEHNGFRWSPPLPPGKVKADETRRDEMEE